jgi:hypothetical protein
MSDSGDIIRISIALDNFSSDFDDIFGGHQDQEQVRETHDSSPPLSPEHRHYPQFEYK